MRFYFTETGWNKAGRHAAAQAQRDGHVVRVIRRKSPLPSQVIYRDDFQVTLVPPKKRAGLP